MQRKAARSRTKGNNPEKASVDIDGLHAHLKDNEGVTDVKFAFSQVKGVDVDVNVGTVYEAVSVALRAATEGRTVDFDGMGDSYGRKRRRGK